MPRGADISPLSLLLGRVDAVADGATPIDTVPTGFPSLDRLLGGGLRRGDLIVLGGDVGSGKSALALAVAMRAAQQRHKVAFYSGEISLDRLHERALAIEGRVRVDDLRQGVPNDVARASVGAAAVRMREGLPRFEALPTDVPGLKEEIEDAKLDLIIVDSLQWFATGKRSTDEE